MPFDPHLNFAYSTVLTAPSPAASGTSIVVQSGDGARFPAVSFNAVVFPAGELPTVANAEIVRVSVKSTDTFTITRAQESTNARTIVVGDQIAAAITLKTLTDIEAGTNFPTLQTIGTLASTGAGPHSITRSANGALVWAIINGNTGAAAYASQAIDADKTEVTLRSYGSGFTTFTHGGLALANFAELWADNISGTAAGLLIGGNGTNGLHLGAFNASGTVNFYAGGNTPRIQLFTSGCLLMLDGTGAVPTGGDKGVGTINAKGVYDDNTLLTDWTFDLHYDGHTVHHVPEGGRLYTIDEVEAVARLERRLPWMPTRANFEQERSLGGMVSRLWFGQEQQQLYIQQLEARIAALEGGR